MTHYPRVSDASPAATSFKPTRGPRCRVGCENTKAQKWHIVCPDCWASLPKSIQEEVWASYREQRGSERHVRAISACFRFLIDRDQANQNA